MRPVRTSFCPGRTSLNIKQERPVPHPDGRRSTWGGGRFFVASAKGFAEPEA